MSNSRFRIQFHTQRMALFRVPLRRLSGLGQQELRGCRSPFRPQLAGVRSLQSSCHLKRDSRSAKKSQTPEDSIERAEQKAASLRKEWVKFSRRLSFCPTISSADLPKINFRKPPRHGTSRRERLSQSTAISKRNEYNPPSSYLQTCTSKGARKFSSDPKLTIAIQRNTWHTISSKRSPALAPWP